MPDRTIYISDDEIQTLLKRYSLDTASVDTALSAEDLDLLVSSAVAEFESKMCSRYVVPLQAIGGSYGLTPEFTRNKVKIVMQALLRVGLAREFNVNNEYSDRDFADDNYKIFKDHLKDFLDIKKKYSLRQQEFADGAAKPRQSFGIARGDNSYGTY